MAISSTSRPFAHNPGPPISGTLQVGNIAIGFTGSTRYDLDYGGVKWWEGPDESLGYVIAMPLTEQTEPTPISGVYEWFRFYQSTDLTDSTFLYTCNSLPTRNGLTPFLSTNDAVNWLYTNGYWTSYSPPPSATPTQTPTPSVTPTITPTITPSVTPTLTPTITPSSTQTPTSSVTLTRTPTNTPSVTPTLTPSITPTITVTQTPTNTVTPSSTQTPTPSVTPTGSLTPTPSITPTNTLTPTPSITPTKTLTPTPTLTPTVTPNIDGFNYTDFSSTSGLSLVGNATTSSNIIYLTTNTNSQTGNVYRSNVTKYNRNFSVQWSFYIGGGTGADGFCLQWSPTNNTTGLAGGGVSRINSSTVPNALSFTTYTVNNVTWFKNNTSQGNQNYGTSWRQTLYYWLDYDNAASQAKLYISTTNSKPGSAAFTYSSFTFDSGLYYIGFGAGTGGSNDNQELISWKLTFT